MNWQRVLLLIVTAAIFVFPHRVSAVEYGSISGIVTNEKGNPAGNVCIVAYTTDGNATTYRANTIADGRYIIYAEVGEYKIHFKTDGSMCGYDEFKPKWYNNKNSMEEADVIQVLANQHLVGFDTQLDYNGKIFGKVTRSGGWALENVCVDLHQSKYLAFAYKNEYFVKTSITDESGNYQLSNLPAGVYKLYFRDCDEEVHRVEAEWHDKASNYKSAIEVGVIYNGGIAQRMVDKQLTMQAVIKGTFSDTSGNPVAGICVELFDNKGTDHKIDNAITEQDGEYLFGNITTGKDQYGYWYMYSIKYNDCTEPDQYIGGYSSIGNFTQEGQHIVHDVIIQKSSSISGRVTNLNGDPIAQIPISIKRGYSTVSSTLTDANGYYTASGLTHNSSYKVLFCEYGCRYSKYEYPDYIRIQEENTHIESINAVLYRPATLRGVVKDKDGNYLSGIDMRLYRNNALVTSIDSYGGSFYIRDLLPGNYTAHFVDLGYGYPWYGNYREPDTYQDHWYDKQETQDKATIVSLGEGENENIEITMLPWGEHFTTPIEIDIKPDNDENIVNCKNESGLIPVALLTTNDVNALDVLIDSLRFGPNQASVAHPQNRHIEDVNNDGKDDLMLHFRVGEAGLACDSPAQVMLSGETISGNQIEGSDQIFFQDKKEESASI